MFILDNHYHDHEKIIQINISRSYISSDGYKLGSRINNIKSREQFIKNKPERKKILIDMGVFIS